MDARLQLESRPNGRGQGRRLTSDEQLPRRKLRGQDDPAYSASRPVCPPRTQEGAYPVTTVRAREMHNDHAHTDERETRVRQKESSQFFAVRRKGMDPLQNMPPKCVEHRHPPPVGFVFGPPIGSFVVFLE